MMVMPIIAMMTSSISSAIGVKIISIIIGSVISTSRCWSLPTCPLSVSRHDRQDPRGRTLKAHLVALTRGITSVRSLKCH